MTEAHGDVSSPPGAVLPPSGKGLPPSGKGLPPSGEGFKWRTIGRVWTFAAAAFLFACFAAYVWTSRNWPLINDPALMHYVVFLMKHGMAPYRQIGDYNFPGAYAPEWFSMAAAAALHLSLALMWRILDAALLVLSGAAMVQIARPYSRFAGLFAGCLFALYHGRDGMEHAAQRDLWATMLLLWAVAALLSAMRQTHAPARLWFAGCFGLLLGAATTIKPLGLEFLLCLVPVLWRQPTWGSRAKLLLAVLAGFALPLDGALLFLHHWQAGRAMLEVVRVYLPYHASLLRGSLLQLLWASALPSVRKLLCLLVVTCVLAGGWRGSLQRLLKEQFTVCAWPGAPERLLLVLCVLLGLLAFVVQGKGYPYHRYPFVAFLFLLAGLEFTAAVRSHRRVVQAAGAAGLIFGVFFCAPSYLRGAAQSRSATPEAPAIERALTMLAGTRGLHSLDRDVQCIDTVSGCIDALLHLRLTQATGTLYDEMLFPQTPSRWNVPYAGPAAGMPVSLAVIAAQKRFQQALLAKPPRVLVVSSWLFPQGPGAYRKLRLWPWFEAYLAQYYDLISQQDFGTYEPGPTGFRVYVRRAMATE